MGSSSSRRSPSPALPIRFAVSVALVLALSPAAALAQITINEVLANPVGTDNGFERLEIYNAGPTAINVTGWCIHDAATIDGNPAPSRCLLPEDFVAAGYEIVYALAEEPWGVRRFFVRDPNGAIVNVMQHL